MVSIIVPVYNVEKYLPECVASVLKLKTDVEILLIDDGSTDGSGALCDKFAEEDCRIRVIHQENGGLSAARNTGIRSAEGEYVLFLDSDDFLDTECTDRMLEQLQPRTDVLLGLYKKYYSDSKQSSAESCDYFLSLEGRIPMEQFLENLPSDGKSCYLTAWRFVCNRAFLLEHDLLFVPGIYHEDDEWTSRLFCKINSIVVTHEFFYMYRQAREGAITSGVKPKHLFDVFDIMKRIEALRDHCAPYLRTYLQKRMALMYLNNMIHLNTLEGKQRQDALKELEYFHDICAGAMSGTIGKMARLCDKMFGLRVTCFALHLARKMMGKH